MESNFSALADEARRKLPKLQEEALVLQEILELDSRMQELAEKMERLNSPEEQPLGFAERTFAPGTKENFYDEIVTRVIRERGGEATTEDFLERFKAERVNVGVNALYSYYQRAIKRGRIKQIKRGVYAIGSNPYLLIEDLPF